MTMRLFGKQSLGNVIDAPVLEGYCPELGNIAMAHAEFMEDMVAVFESMHSVEMAGLEIRKEHNGVALESIGAEYLESHEIVVESAIGGVYKKLKDFIMKMWGKIKGFFANIRTRIDAMLKSGKDFAKKYRVEILKKSNDLDKDFEVKIYNYTNLESKNNPYEVVVEKIGNKLGGDASDLSLTGAQGILDLYTEEKIEKEILKPIRAAITGGRGEKEDFSKECFKHFRDGAEGKEDVKASKPDVSVILKVLEENKSQKELDELKKSMDDSFKTIIKEIDDAAKEQDNQLKDEKNADVQKQHIAVSAVMRKKSTVFSKAQTICGTFVNAWYSAISEREKSYKKVCMAVLSYKPSKK